MRQAVIFVVLLLTLIAASEATSFSEQLIRSQQNEARDSEPVLGGGADDEEESARVEMAQTIQRQQHPHQHAQALAQPVRLPRINIYASENEVKKLLGIDNRIDYVSNGQLNTYPLGFTIPMGYHLSDMIFTWQNLGPTNVNYSISLVIGNPVAVERPLINITRSGLIPRHEQVFKITLPCSGKLTDEVDVQVLINIQGLVPVEQLQAQQSSADLSDSTPISQADFQLARAVQNANNELPRAVNQTTSSTASPAQSTTSSNQIADQLQADEARTQQQQQQQQQMRQVGHTIAIKRKKICTMHPVPVQPVTRSPETIRPPNQVPSTASQESSVPLNERGSSKWPGPIQVEQQSTLRSSSTPTTTTSTTTTTTTTPEPPAHLHTWPSAPSTSSNSIVAESTLSPQASNQRARQLGGPMENPLIELLRQQQQQQIASNALPQTTAGGNPLLLALIVMSLVLIAMLLLAAAASAHNNVAAMRHVGVGARPIDKLNALTNCILRRSGAAGATTRANKSMPSGNKNATNAFNTLNLGAGFQDDLSRTHANFVVGPFAGKSAAGANTISGRLHHQQQQQQQHSLYYYKQQQHNYLTTGPGYYQQQQQQHHYQCPPDLLFGTPTTTTTTTTTNEPYHINMNNTTKLYLGRPNLDNGGNYTIDNNYTTTPIVPQTRSDSGSVYQTIY